MVKRLSSGDWFTSRTSACGFYAPAYFALSKKGQEEWKKGFAVLCNDDTPMVRRAAATHLAKFIKVYYFNEVVEKESLVGDMVPLVHALAQDEQDSVRLLTVECFISLAISLGVDQVKSVLGQTLSLLCQDSSWRVRYMVADKFVQITGVCGPEMIKDLQSVFVKLLKDTESEVRTASCNQLPGFCALVPAEAVLSDNLPVVKDLISDTSQHVRAALASHVSAIAPILGKQNTMDQLLPLFLQLLKDEASEVRLNVISKLDGVNQGICD
jgi:serine/threonine-protein phosphatase 2A regulatory subunit A